MGRWFRIAPAGLTRRIVQRCFVAAYIVFLAICWLTHQRFQCLLVTTPFLGLLVFAITAFFQFPIIQSFRDSGRDRAAFAVLLVLAAGMMFLDGEMMAIDHYRKGLVHFQNDHQAIWSIPSSDRVDFFFDYGRKEIVLKAAGMGDELEVRRSFADLECQ